MAKIEVISLIVLIAILSISTSDAQSGSASACVNHPPIIQSIPNQTATVGVLFNLTVNASDEDNQSLTYGDNTTLFNINSTSGVIQFTPGSTSTEFILINASDGLNCSNSITNTTFKLEISSAVAMSITNLTISQKYDNQTPVLNWNAFNASNYTIYYSSDLNTLKNYALGGSLDGITKIQGVNTTEYNDTNHNQNQTRYYRVSAVGDGEVIINTTVGKYTYYLIGLNTGTNDEKRKNWVTFPFNETTDAETYVSSIPGDVGIRVAKLIRDSSNSFSYFGHEKGGGNNFNMSPGTGYQVEVSQDVNYTLVGTAFQTLTTHNLFGKSTGTNDNYRKNWVSIGYSTIPYDAEKYIANVPGDVGIRTAKLIRSNSNSYSYFSHEKGGGNNFSMLTGIGYQAETSQDANYTLT